jgi:hypothetical protein
MTLTFAQVKAFLISKYKAERLYGHSDKGKGDRIVSRYLSELNENGRSIISRHESASGEVIPFTAADVVGAVI